MDDRTYAWNYFSAHASQRMAVFQFYITLVTAIFGGGVLIAGSADSRRWSAVLFILVPFLSFIFDRLDRRTSKLIKAAEAALMDIERESSGEGSLRSIFIRDHTPDRRTYFDFSYSRCFRLVFWVASTVGIVAACIANSTLPPALSGGNTSSGIPASISGVCEYSPTPSLPRCTRGYSEHGLCLYYSGDLSIVLRE
ncbi:RipA family octameric membrane protein [Stenotrophomonas rhizophila]